MSTTSANLLERRERAEHIADVLAIFGFIFCIALGAIPGVLLFGPPGLVAGGALCAPLGFVTGALVNKLPFMRDVY